MGVIAQLWKRGLCTRMSRFPWSPSVVVIKDENGPETMKPLIKETSRSQKGKNSDELVLTFRSRKSLWRSRPLSWYNTAWMHSWTGAVEVLF